MGIIKITRSGPPKKRRANSLRLKGYDYSSPGEYFITICVQDRLHLFGKIDVPGNESNPIPVMILNDAGRMIGKWYYELENKFPGIKCREMIIMPNHFHAIIEIIGHPSNPGADQRVCPSMNERNVQMTGEHDEKTLDEYDENNRGEHKDSPLFSVIQWFKTMTTNEYIRCVKKMNWEPFHRKLWQRNYYDRIINNEKSYNAVRKYIINNPAKWQSDEFVIK